MANKTRWRKKRQEEAEVRKAERAERTDSEQIALLDRRLGEGTGAARERERLLRRIELSKSTKTKKKNKKV
tara:strand:- start:5420 stop:5632 length:213 start_codon:yes stop_codon:yes gene_type:complete